MPAFNAPVMGSLSEYRHKVCYAKIEWLDLPDAKKGSSIPFLVSTEFTNVTDGQKTDGRTPHDGTGRAYA